MKTGASSMKAKNVVRLPAPHDDVVATLHEIGATSLQEVYDEMPRQVLELNAEAHDASKGVDAYTVIGRLAMEADAEGLLLSDYIEDLREAIQVYDRLRGK